MIHLMLFLFALTSFALPDALISRYELIETHEFYQDNELIQRPLDAWQAIAAFSTVNTDLSLSKVCLKYYLKSQTEGTFRVEKKSMTENCSGAGEIISEIKNLRGLQFQRTPHFKITFTYQNFSTSEWNISLRKKNDLRLLETPDRHLDETVLFVSSGSENTGLLKDGTQCLKVLDDCTVEGTSVCHQCENGFLEAPNGCLISSQYCLKGSCGKKGGPACRRGVKFLRKRVLDCRTDASFAFCEAGSTPVCQGQEVWCH